MTLERASELVAKLDGEDKRDLFCHFVDHFDLMNENIVSFAMLCGFTIAQNVVIRS